MTRETRTRRVWRIFWAWEDEREEAWLQRMAREGWHLRHAGIPVYTFERGAPTDTVYKLDYQVLGKRDRAEYEGIFRASGWEHVCELANWHYFRTDAGSTPAPDIFTDVESRVAKYKRLLAVLVIFLPIVNIGFVNLLRRPHHLGSDLLDHLLVGATLVQAGVMVLMAYAVVRLALRIRELRRAPR